MAFKEEDMYPYVRKVLRKRYPKEDGWEIKPQERRKGYIPDFVVEKKRQFLGTIERVIVEVKRGCQVSDRDVKQLNDYVKKMAGGNVNIKEKILVVPAGADTSRVPEDIKVIRLRKFKCK